MKKIIFFNSDEKVWHQMFKDIQKDEEVAYVQGVVSFKHKMASYLFTLCFSNKINKCVNIPFKNIWFKFFYDDCYKLSEKPIFIFTRENFKFLELGYAKYLKNKYPKCRIIMYFTDIHTLRNYKFDKIRGLYDEAFIFDEKEAKKYNISYYPLCYSHSELEKCHKKYDICFIGQDKGRIKEIYATYLKAKEMNITCKIIICGKFDETQKLKYPDFEFIEYLPYDEVLKYISKSKFNLEICLADTDSISIRLYESIMFNQGLITNNLNIKKSPYYNESYIHILDFEDINLSFVKKYKEIENKELKEEISPIRFIEYIKKYK